jgi:hypothetical protein
MKLREFIEFVKEEIDFHKRHPELLIALLISGSTYFILKEVNR